MPDLHLDHVGKRYPGERSTTALRDISLDIPQGSFIAVEGPSGGGKSTLLNLIGLLDTPSSGLYRVGGLDLAIARERHIAEARSDTFAFIFQAFHLLDRRPAVDSVEMNLLYRGLPRVDRRRRALQALSSVNIAHLAHHKANQLSGGERQRVAIARALAAGAPVVLADEPTGNLDSANGRAVTDALHLFHERGATVVLVTHSPETADVAQRRITLRDGSIEHRAGESIELQIPGPPQPPGRPSTIRLVDLMVDAIDSLRSRVMRSLSLIAAVALGVALAVATIGISVSAGAQVSRTFDAHRNRDVSLTWSPASLAGQSASQLESLPDRLSSLAGVQAVSLISSYGKVDVQANPERPTYQVPAYGETGNYADASRSSVTWTPGHRKVLNSGEILIGETLAKQMLLGPLVGRPLITVEGVSMAVAGIIATSPRVTDALGAVILPQRDADSDLGSATTEQALILTSSGAAQQVARQAPLVVNPYDPTELQVSAPIDPSTLRAQINSEVQIALAIFTGVALLASIAGLANTTILAVLERRQEFGLRRAVGARPKHIFSLVIAESLTLGAIGGLVGLIGGLGAVLAVTLANRWSPVFDIRIAPAAILGGLAVGAFGGLVASVRAARIKPSDALRS